MTLTHTDRLASLLVFLSTVLLTTLIAIAVDTSFYQPHIPLLRALVNSPTITPLNSLLYNTRIDNLSAHGIHPYYQHLTVSLPLLLGPSLFLLVFYPQRTSKNIPLISSLSGSAILSCIPHQEPRFLLPAVPLILSSLQLPRSKTTTRYWLVSWIFFNAILGVFMGILHQGGVIPAQLWLGQEQVNTANMTQVFWWRTYSPPIWLLDHNPLKTTDLMGMPFTSLQNKITSSFSPSCNPEESVGLVAPYSSMELDRLTFADNSMLVEEIWRYDRHLNLDDLDFASDGVWTTVRRSIGRRGLMIWRFRRDCNLVERGKLHGDW